MSRLSIPSRDDAPAASQPLLDAVGQQLGVIPNLFRLVGKVLRPSKAISA